MEIKSLNLYQIQHGLDKLTFRASSDDIAKLITIQMGELEQPKRCIKYINKDISQEIFTGLVTQSPVSELQEMFGDIGEFITANRKDLTDALESFAYTSLEGRADFDALLNAPGQMHDFLFSHKKSHEADGYGPLTQAWDLAKELREIEEYEREESAQ